jgi:hypothetical protein
MEIVRKARITIVAGVLLLAPAALTAFTQLIISGPMAISDGVSGDKPKIQRAGDGTLVVVYGDNTPGAGYVYDPKADEERPARDVYVKTCKPGTLRGDVVRTCDVREDWSAALNISNSARQSSLSTAWRGGDAVADRLPFPGDIDKVNIKPNGPMLVATWIGNYCPDGDVTTAGVQPTVQRAVRYVERGNRVVPFACPWVSYSTNNGVAWSAPRQLSTGERDAKQDAHSGSVNTDQTSPNYRKGQVIISWQEDPQGLQLGEAEGPGEGASGSMTTNGTDIWYAYATVDLSQPGTPGDDFALAAPRRLSDNWAGQYGGENANIFDGAGSNVDANLIEKGHTGASRANIGMVGTTAIVAYEERKGADHFDDGKFVRYHAFPYAAPPADAAGRAGCILSNPNRNSRRVRFVTQSPADAGPGGIQLAIFWREGVDDHGGPGDIVVRRGMGGVQPAQLTPAVAAGCATSDYATAMSLPYVPAENISSHSPVATGANLLDDSEANPTENAKAHRALLRGADLWVGYSYTQDLVKLWAQLDNYNFWLRKYTVGTGWGAPGNMSQVTDPRINVQEPRLVGTPKSNTACTTDPTQCQNPDVILLAWGTQENVSPYDAARAHELGIFVTVSTDAAQTFAPAVRYSTAAGALFGDDEYAYESQIVTRPDGLEFYGVWNQGNTMTGLTYAAYARGQVTEAPTPLPSISVGDASVTEGNEGTTNLVFAVSLSSSPTAAVTVNYATGPGSATAGADYATASGALTFEAGVLTRNVTVPIVGDLVDEPDETLFLNLSGAANATIGDGVGVGTILDDDAPPPVVPTVSAGDATVLEGDDGTAALGFAVTLSASPASPVTVNYATGAGADNPATAGIDYTTTAGVLTFAAGASGAALTQVVNVPVIGDTVFEPSETLFLTLSGAVNATILDGQGLGTIADDDPRPGLVAAYGFEEAGGSTATDSAGGDNNGTLGPEVARVPARTTAGRFGRALSFDGADDWVTVGDAANLDLTGSMTLSAWVYPTVLGNAIRPVLWKERINELSYGLVAADGGNLPLAGLHTGSGYAVATGSAPLQLNAWSHLAATYDGSVLNLYVNARLVATLPASSPVTASGDPLRIGGSSPLFGLHFAGLIDEVRIYGQAQTLAEITADMNTPVAPVAETYVAVPDVVGSMLADAEAAIAAAGLVVGSVTATENAAAAGTVLTQDRGAGARVPKGTALRLTISAGPMGPAPCTAPPNAPGSLTVSSSGAGWTLAWAPAGPAGANAPTSYNLEADVTNPFSGSLAAPPFNTGSPATTYTFTAPAGTHGTFYLRVRSVNGCGTSAGATDVVKVIVP